MPRRLSPGRQRYAIGLLVGLLTGCAAAPPPDTDTAQTIAEILAAPAPNKVESLRCLPTYAYSYVEVLDRQHVLFSANVGDKRWLNQLRTPCLGLRRTDTLVFRLRSSQICNLDSFEGVSDPWWWVNRTTGTCVLGDFQPVTKHQVELVRNALKIEPRAAHTKIEPAEQGSTDGSDD